MTDLTPGTRVLVTFPGPIEGQVTFAGNIRIDGRIHYHTVLSALGATITPVIPDEPGVGSVWLDEDGVTWLRSVWTGRQWWSGRDGDVDQWLTWPEVVARGGSLLHRAGGAS